MGLRVWAGISFEKALPKRDASVYFHGSKMWESKRIYMELLLKSPAPSSIQNSQETRASTQKGFTGTRSFLSLPPGLQPHRLHSPLGVQRSFLYWVTFLERIYPCVLLFCFLCREKEATSNHKMLFLEQRLRGGSEPSHFNFFIQWDNNTCLVIPIGNVNWWLRAKAWSCNQPPCEPSLHCYDLFFKSYVEIRETGASEA